MKHHRKLICRIHIRDTSMWRQLDVPLDPASNPLTVTCKESEWQLQYRIIDCEEHELSITLTRPERAFCYYEIIIPYAGHSIDDYLVLPAAVYQSNRFESRSVPYPPMLEADVYATHPDTAFITDVPRFDMDGLQSTISLCSGDLGTTVAAWFSPQENYMGMVQFPHMVAGRYTGCKAEEDLQEKAFQLTLQIPCMREKVYTSCRVNDHSDDFPFEVRRGEAILIPFGLREEPCTSIMNLNRSLFFLRSKGYGSRSRNLCIPFSKAFTEIEKDYNENQYNHDYGYYRVAPPEDGNRFVDWQAGWVGGGMNCLALMMRGNELSATRSDTTMDSIFSFLQYPSGLIYPVFYNGKLYGDNFLDPDDTRWVLLRKSADILLFACRYIESCNEGSGRVKPLWINGVRKLADAFLFLWETHGQFGQFVDAGDLSLFVSGTVSASTAIGGLAAAGTVLQDERYLFCARDAGQYYHDTYLEKGYTNGGPGEILQAPDSESAFGLLESFVELYERTGEKRWINYAQEAAWLASTWVMDYDFSFPERSLFSRMGMKTAGTVWANIQNKHSAPGICTLSGVSLLKLYRATGVSEYMELGCDIARALMQYVSIDERPIHDFEGSKLPFGWVNERVNTSDWEGKQRVGEVFYGACWAAVSALLTYAEFPGVYLDLEHGRCFTADHVVTDFDGKILTIYNSTMFDSELYLLIEEKKDKLRPLGSNPLSGSRKLAIDAGERVKIPVQL